MEQNPQTNSQSFSEMEPLKKESLINQNKSTKSNISQQQEYINQMISKSEKKTDLECFEEIIGIDRNKRPKIYRFLKYFLVYKKIGNTHFFFDKHTGKAMIVIGPNWVMFIIFFSLVVFGYLIFWYFFWKYLNIYFRTVGIFSLISFCFSYIFLFILDPGVSKYDRGAFLGRPKGRYGFCERCKLFVRTDYKTMHCLECGVCIEGYNHHCPWTSKCIGRKNQCLFWIFIFLFMAAFVYIVLAFVFAQEKYYKLKFRKRRII